MLTFDPSLASPFHWIKPIAVFPIFASLWSTPRIKEKFFLHILTQPFEALVWSSLEILVGKTEDEINMLPLCSAAQRAGLVVWVAFLAHVTSRVYRGLDRGRLWMSMLVSWLFFFTGIFPLLAISTTLVEHDRTVALEHRVSLIACSSIAATVDVLTF